VVNDLNSVSVLGSAVSGDAPEMDAQSVVSWDLLLPIMAIASIMVLVMGGISVLLVAA